MDTKIGILSISVEMWSVTVVRTVAHGLGVQWRHDTCCPEQQTSTQSHTLTSSCRSHVPVTESWSCPDHLPYAAITTERRFCTSTGAHGLIYMSRMRPQTNEKHTSIFFLQQMLSSSPPRVCALSHRHLCQIMTTQAAVPLAYCGCSCVPADQAVSYCTAAARSSRTSDRGIRFSSLGHHT